VTDVSDPPRIEQASKASSSPSERFGPVTILRIYVVLLILVPPTYIIEPLGAAGTPASVVGIFALCLWAVAVASPGENLRRTVVPLRVVLGFFAGSVLLSYAILHTGTVPVAELLSSDRALLHLASWAGVALLGAEGLRDREDLYRVLRTLVGAVAIMGILGALQFYAGVNLVAYADQIPGLHANTDLFSIGDRNGFRRPAGTASHPIEFGCILAMALPVALHLARFDRARSATRRWLPLAAIATGVPVAVSRSAVVCALVAFIVIFLGLDPKLRPRALVSMAALSVFFYATAPGLLGTLRDLFLHTEAYSARTSDYEVVAEYVQQSPLIGRGPGTFLPTTYLYLDNQYLLSIIEIGILGLFTLIAYLLTTAILARGARHRSSDPRIRDLGQALAATGISGAVASFTFDGFSFLMYAGLIPLCMGIAGALWQMQRTAIRTSLV
jgi:polysaccharide biosynthesis protein PslJ